MRVEGSGSIQSAVKAPATDSVSKNIRAQIMNAQKQLQELAANKDMEPEEKMERRKEIQQQIADLNQQLRQHEMEVRQEKQQQAKQAEKNTQTAEKKAEKVQENKAAGLSQGSMEAMISAERTTQQSKVQGRVASEMKARKGVLESEIAHAGRGAAVGRKKESVADIETKLEDIAKSQAESLHKANEELKNAGEKDRAEKKQEAKDENAGAKTGETQTAGRGEALGVSAGRKEDGVAKESKAAEAQDDKDAAEKKQEEAKKALQEATANAEIPVFRRVDILL